MLLFARSDPFEPRLGEASLLRQQCVGSFRQPLDQELTFVARPRRFGRPTEKLLSLEETRRLFPAALGRG